MFPCKQSAQQFPRLSGIVSGAESTALALLVASPPAYEQALGVSRNSDWGVLFAAAFKIAICANIRSVENARIYFVNIKGVSIWSSHQN